MRIPYGISDFATIRREGYFYVDKTPFLPVLENPMSGYVHLLFLRPRRFGKSTIVSTLANYYDIAKADQFDELFRGLWIHEHPTAERNKYLVLKFDFSTVETTGTLEDIRSSFISIIKVYVRQFALAYAELIPGLATLANRLDSHPDASSVIADLLAHTAGNQHRVYAIIDEYDHFANRLLAAGEEGAYESLKGTGFVRTFYATLKSGTTSGTVARVFMTGVTPLMLDDMSSGFNITRNISMTPRFDTFAGFTRIDVERALDEFVQARPDLSGHLADRTELFKTLEANYDGYRFSSHAAEPMFNSDMVLYFLGEVDERRQLPKVLLDLNVRTTYEHLAQVGTKTGSSAAERREILETILVDRTIRSEIVERFGVGQLDGRAPFISLLYYLGMLTLSALPQSGVQWNLEIPNRVIRELQWEHLAKHLQREANFAIDTAGLASALEALAVRGKIEPLLQLFHERILQQISVKDTRNLGEKTIKLLLMMYVSLGKVFYALSEKEFAQGYCDLFLAAAKNVPGLEYSWLIEFKYVKAKAKDAEIEAAFGEAAAQVEKYSKDTTLLPMLVGDYQLRCGIIVFVGTKRIQYRSWPDDAADERVEVPAKRTKKAARRAR